MHLLLLLLLLVRLLQSIVLHQHSIPQSTDHRHDNFGKGPGECDNCGNKKDEGNNEGGEIVGLEFARGEYFCRHFLGLIDKAVVLIGAVWRLDGDICNDIEEQILSLLVLLHDAIFLDGELERTLLERGVDEVVGNDASRQVLLTMAGLLQLLLAVGHVEIVSYLLQFGLGLLDALHRLHYELDRPECRVVFCLPRLIQVVPQPLLLRLLD